MKYLFVLVLSLFTYASAVAKPSDFPAPPSGYSWVSCSETKSAFLKPDGWFFKEERKGSGTWGYFISKENIEKAGSFITGLSVNVIKDVPSKAHASAPDYAAAFIDEAAQTHKVVAAPWSKTLGPFHQFGVRTLVADPKGGDYITHTLAIGNEQTGTVYVLIFEAPVASWDAAWKVGEPILKKFSIDTDI